MPVSAVQMSYVNIMGHIRPSCFAIFSKTGFLDIHTSSSTFVVSIVDIELMFQ